MGQIRRPHGTWSGRALTVPVSVVVITKNEEAQIEPCLSGVAWAGEVIVVDAQSTDRTVELVQSFGARVFSRDWPGYAPQKNFGIDQATQPWVLSLDADEVVTPALASEIAATVLHPEFDAYRLFRPTFFMGKALRHYGRAPKEPGHIRLFRRGLARFNDRLVNEAVEYSGPVGTLKERLPHYSYPNLGGYWHKIHRYAVLEAQERVLHGAPTGGRWVRGFGKVGWMLLRRRGVVDGPRAWVWIAGQGYQEWLATGLAARLERASSAGPPPRPSPVKGEGG